MTKVKKEIKKRVALIILDGWGIAPASKGNAISLARKPTLDYLQGNYPETQLEASGESVGLRADVPGHSEAGHLNLGAGRVVLDDSLFISQSIANNMFFENQALIKTFEHVNKNKSHLHLMGLLSESATGHADPDHLIALLEMAKKHGVEKVFLHLFSDGRDATAHSLLKAYAKIKPYINGAKIVSLIGRAYAMDRTKDWKKIEKAYNLLVLGEGKKFNTLGEAVSYAYNRSGRSPALLTDEYIPASYFPIDDQPVTINDNDGLIFFNLRSDRARQLTKVFVQTDFNKKNPGSFRRKKVLKNLFFCALTEFGPDLDDIKTAFPSRRIENSITATLKGFSQSYISEKEKYAHVTYFFNGGHDQPVAGEKRILIASPNIESYEEKPEMNAQAVTERVVQEIKKGTDFVVVNFANPDILGHTGNVETTIKAIEFIDRCLGKIHQAAALAKMVMIITADHGNADEMIDLKTKEAYHGHSMNPVPFILVSRAFKKAKLKKGVLGDVAPTILEIMDVAKPKEMIGQSLLK